MQLGSEEGGSLGDIEALYHQALDIDAHYVPALLELGWFHYAVNDDARKALSFFERALDLAEEDVAEAARGREECLNEIRDRTLKSVPSEISNATGVVCLETNELELLRDVVVRRCPEFEDLVHVVGQRRLTFEEGVNLRRPLSDEYLERGLDPDGKANEYGELVDGIFGKLEHLSAAR